MKIILLIAAGGALGSVARYLMGKLSLALWGPDFPWGTMIVNVLGCFIMGVLAAFMAHYTEFSQEVRAFLMVGVLGGFTTFSAFALDFVSLTERGSYMSAAFYIIGSVLLSVSALMAGLYLVRNLLA